MAHKLRMEMQGQVHCRKQNINIGIETLHRNVDRPWMEKCAKTLGIDQRKTKLRKIQEIQGQRQCTDTKTKIEAIGKDLNYCRDRGQREIQLETKRVREIERKSELNSALCFARLYSWPQQIALLHPHYAVERERQREREKTPTFILILYRR